MTEGPDWPGRALRLVVHDYAGHPFPIQLSRRLAAKGHRVLHLYCASRAGCQGPVAPLPEDAGSLSIHGISAGRGSATSFGRRFVHEVRYGQRVAQRASRFSPDLVISANTPLLSQRALLGAAEHVGARFIFWQQDVLGIGIQAILHRKFGPLGAGLGAFFVAFERDLVRRSDGVVTISPDFTARLDAWGVDPRRCRVIENWAPLNDLPSLPKDNAWARANGLANKLVFLYAGTLGLKHEPAVLIALAKRLSHRSDARLVVVSEGSGAAWLEDAARREPLNSLVLLPFQDYGRLAEVHAAADVLFAILGEDAGEFSVPSKVLAYLCAARPILAVIPSNNLAARTIRSSGAGLVVHPGDEGGLSSSVDALVSDIGLRTTLGERGRRYAMSHFEIDAIADRFEDAFDAALREAPGRWQRTRRRDPDADAPPTLKAGADLASRRAGT